MKRYSLDTSLDSFHSYEYLEYNQLGEMENTAIKEIRISAKIKSVV